MNLVSLMCWKRVYLNLKRWEIKYEVLKFSKVSKNAMCFFKQMVKIVIFGLSREKWNLTFSSFIFLWRILWAKDCGGPFTNIQVLIIALLKIILFYRKGFFDSFLVHMVVWHTLFLSRKLAPSMSVPCLPLWKTIIINGIFYLGTEIQELWSESFIILVSKGKFISRR